MLIGVGCDVIEIARVQKAIEREAFVERVYAPSEIAYCRSRGKQAAASFAARFAAKEAVLKALGMACAAASLRKSSLRMTIWASPTCSFMAIMRSSLVSWESKI